MFPELFWNNSSLGLYKQGALPPCHVKGSAVQCVQIVNAVYMSYLLSIQGFNMGFLFSISNFQELLDHYMTDCLVYRISTALQVAPNSLQGALRCLCGTRLLLVLKSYTLVVYH